MDRALNLWQPSDLVLLTIGAVSGSRRKRDASVGTHDRWERRVGLLIFQVDNMTSRVSRKYLTDCARSSTTFMARRSYRGRYDWIERLAEIRTDGRQIMLVFA